MSRRFFLFVLAIVLSCCQDSSAGKEKGVWENFRCFGNTLRDKARIWFERPGSCPPVRNGTVGHCAEFCTSDWSCPLPQKCCSNGCGHQCMTPIF